MPLALFAKKPVPSEPARGDDDVRPVAELKDVCLSFGEKEILKGITFQVLPKDRFVVMGKSGGGKSTLLRLILGILQPTAGSVQFNGVEVTRMGRHRLNRMRQKIGMVYQYSALISSLSVRGNLALPLEELTDKKPGEINEIVEQKLEMVGMADSIDAMPAELSGGMRKRIGLARALVNDPELILYDEPSAGLDPVTSSTIDELMIELSEKIGATSIIVTHEMESAFRVATRMAMIYEGVIHAEGTPDEVRNHEDPVVQQFITGGTEGPLTETVD
jgi:phospholipid/cholesterol/gamma-HCH transport system ATP-binding protein